jgi:hypothetical protein
VTLKFSRTEFQDLSRALGMTFYLLVGASDGKPITAAEQETAETFLPKIQRLFNALTRILDKQGWLDDDQDDDIEEN